MVKKPATAKPAGTVPESVLKKRKRDEDWAAKKAANAGELKKKSREQRKEIFKRAENYVKEYRDQVQRSHSSALTEGPVLSTHDLLFKVVVAVAKRAIRSTSYISFESTYGKMGQS